MINFVVLRPRETTEVDLHWRTPPWCPPAPPTRSCDEPLGRWVYIGPEGTGILMGVGGFGFLAGITSVGVAVMVAGLTLNGRVGGGLVGIWSSLLAFHIVQLTGVLFHHLRLGPLASPRPSESSSCIVLPAAAGS